MSVLSRWPARPEALPARSQGRQQLAPLEHAPLPINCCELQCGTKCFGRRVTAWCVSFLNACSVSFIVSVPKCAPRPCTATFSRLTTRECVGRCRHRAPLPTDEAQGVG